MIFGINYPWTVFEGRANYGCDFGTNIWNSHSGVTQHVDEVRADLEAMSGTGLEVVRWFVFTDGRGGIAWNAEGELTGFADGFFDFPGAWLVRDGSAPSRIRPWLGQPVSPIRISLPGNATAIRLRMASTWEAACLARIGKSSQ